LDELQEQSKVLDYCKET